MGGRWHPPGVCTCAGGGKRNERNKRGLGGTRTIGRRRAAVRRGVTAPMNERGLKRRRTTPWHGGGEREGRWRGRGNNDSERRDGGESLYTGRFASNVQLLRRVSRRFPRRREFNSCKTEISRRIGILFRSKVFNGRETRAQPSD